MPAELGLPGFEEVEEVGRGAFGVVYRARQVDLDRMVAIKVLTGIYDDQAQNRFDRERRALGALSAHPNIVAVHGSGITPDGRPYIVMEYAPGGSLADRIASSGPVPWVDAAEIGAKLADALAASHAAGVLHRDVKPENVLFSAYDEPMLADFGIARLAGGPATRTGVVTASLAQAAPEVLEGKRPSEAADVYSLASTTFSAVAGQAPFMKDTDESLIPMIARVATEPPPDLRSRGIPDGVCTVLERGLAKDAEQRGTAVEFGQALRAAAAGRTPSAPASAPVAAVTAPAATAPAASDATNPHPVPASTATADSTPVEGGPPPVATITGSGDGGSRRRRNVLVAGGVAAIIVAAAAAVALAGGGSSNSAGGDKHHHSTTTTTKDKTGKETANYKSFVQRIENIVQQSTVGRGQLGPIIANVQSCSTDPFDASRQTQAVIDNRQSILNQLAALSSPPNIEASNFTSLLQRALESSINADIQYKSWMDFVSSVGCVGSAPQDSAFSAAQADDVNSTSLKTQFVDAFNPVAARFGLQTWQATDF